jgi:hypothetical protein
MWDCRVHLRWPGDFYGVDLYRPGFYTVDVNNEPGGGICTLMLSR